MGATRYRTACRVKLAADGECQQWRLTLTPDLEDRIRLTLTPGGPPNTVRESTRQPRGGAAVGTVESLGLSQRNRTRPMPGRRRSVPGARMISPQAGDARGDSASRRSTTPARGSRGSRLGLNTDTSVTRPRNSRAKPPKVCSRSGM